MTVGEMLDRMSAREFRGWQIFDHIEHEDFERRRNQAVKPKPVAEAEELA